jgi:hypothetical protein
MVALEKAAFSAIRVLTDKNFKRRFEKAEQNDLSRLPGLLLRD